MKNRGYILIQALVFSSISVIILGSLISWAGINIKASRLSVLREQALQIAESGIDYYRWHLAHAPNDFTDGTGNPGPYTKPFYDKDGNQIGSFTLTIIPPQTGFTLVTVISSSTLVSDPSISRAIKVRLAIPSFAKYAVVANDNMRFGEGTEVFGPIHSNGGIRFDGLAHNLISSSKDVYDDPDHNGDYEFGVHTHLNSPPTSSNLSFRALEAPPNSVQNRSDVFEAGRTFPVPTVDFVGMTSDLSSMKSKAQANSNYFSSSGALGYHVVLKTNDTYDVYRVNQMATASNNCVNYSDIGQVGWGVWSIRTGNSGQTFLSNKSFPSDGIIFFEDNVWVDGAVNSARLTIASGKFPDSPNTRTNIIVNENLLYTNYDGSDVIALIAQGNVNTGMISADNLRIDAALMSQNGKVGRYFYASQCSPYDIRDTIDLYGMIGTNQRYGFAYTNGSGYQNRNIIYDANLLYGPPPSFPLTSDQYQIISWEEVR